MMEPYIALISRCFPASWMAPQMLLLMTAVGPPDCAENGPPFRTHFSPPHQAVEKRSSAALRCNPQCSDPFGRLQGKVGARFLSW